MEKIFTCIPPHLEPDALAAHVVYTSLMGRGYHTVPEMHKAWTAGDDEWKKTKLIRITIEQVDEFGNVYNEEGNSNEV